ncbi:MAG: hypothetical protein KC800_09035 [Candidatus Eremiobacteraeota bacterium]|nr:hypothetical protein [Candidatus Eremiobacteraeota bacterium]
MNITSTRINQQPKFNTEAAPSSSITFADQDNGGGIKDGFVSAGRILVDNPIRTITNVTSLGAMAGNLATMGSGTANANFMAGTGIVTGMVLGTSAFLRGIDGLSSLGYSNTGMFNQPDPKKVAISALGDAISAAGHFAMATGVTTPAAALIVGGAVISSACDYSAG